MMGVSYDETGENNDFLFLPVMYYKGPEAK